MATAITDDLAALIHHVELTEAGWHDKALDLFVLRALLDESLTLSLGQVRDSVNKRLPAPLGLAQVKQITDRLLQSGALLATPSERLKLSEATRADLTAHAEEARVLDQAMAEWFGTVFLPVLGTTSAEDWHRFRDSFLRVLIRELGARAYELVTGERSGVEQTAAFRSYVGAYPPELQARLSRSIAEFIDPSSPTVRKWVLSHLNATFVWHVLGLPENALRRLHDRTGAPVIMNVLVDTNFLFSLVGLHDNPADDVVEALAELVETARDKVTLNLWMMPFTYDEAVRTVHGYEIRLAGFYISSGVARVARERPTDLDSITLKFVLTAMHSPTPLNARDYFRPFRENLIRLAGQAGVRLKDEDVDYLSMDQRVIDDLNDQIEYQKRDKVREPKRYEILLHDMMLWHYARRGRPARVESPLDANWWIATLDYRFIAFDRSKARRSRRLVPLCVHPTVLLQMLQLWIPRTEELETAVVESLRPLVPFIHDRDSERVTVRILRALSRHEDGSGIDETTAATVLLDSALRATVASAPNVEGAIVAVEESLTAQKAEAEARAKELTEEKVSLQAVIGAQTTEMESLAKKVKVLETAVQRREALEVEITDLQGAVEAHREAGEKAKAALARIQAQVARRQAWTIAGALVIVAAVGFGILGASLTPAVSLAAGKPSWAVCILLEMVAFALSTSVGSLAAHRQSVIRDSGAARHLYAITRYAWGALILGLVLQVVADALTGSPSVR